MGERGRTWHWPLRGRVPLVPFERGRGTPHGKCYIIQDKVINTDSAFCIFLMVRVVRLARTVRVIVEARVDWTVTVWSRKIARMIWHRV